MNEFGMSWDHVASAFGALTTLLLTYLLTRIGKIEEKQAECAKEATKEINNRVTFQRCKEFREECERLKHHAVECGIANTQKEVNQIWDALNTHTHTNLPVDTVVIRRRNNDHV